MDTFDIHNRERNLRNAVTRIKNSSNISDKNRELILKFHDECFSNGLSIDRVLFYLDRLFKIAQWLRKDFQTATKEDIKELIGRIERSNYAENTKKDYKIAIKRFYKWLEGSDEDYPEKVRWIRTTLKKNRKKLTNLPSQEDVKKLIQAATSIRDKALISVLYESGCRVGELLNIKLNDVEFDDYGVKILVSGKTGPRRIRLISSVPHLANWIQNHPKRQDPNNPLWVNIGTWNHGKPMKYSTFRKELKEYAQKAGIQKPVNPHAFRKARATHLATKLTEAQMDEYFGWTQGSNMPAIYVHLSGRDIDKAILSIHGKLPREDKSQVEELKPKECPRCHYENPAEVKLCGRCMLPLDEKTAIELEKRKKEFLANVVTPEIIERMIEEKVKQILEMKES